jgi:tetratricopeptide (TPR) repeat protein
MQRVRDTHVPASTWLATIAFLFVSWLSPCTFAQARGDKEQARVLAREATLHYKLGEYEDALKKYKEAFRTFQEPSLLFNIGQCHRQLGHKQEAEQAYKSYLRDLPQAENRPEVERLIEGIQAAIEQERQDKDRAPSGAIDVSKMDAFSPATVPTIAPSAQQEVTPIEVAQTPVENKESSTTSGWLWVGIGAAVVVGVIGIVAISSGSTTYPSANTTSGTVRF